MRTESRRPKWAQDSTGKSEYEWVQQMMDGTASAGVHLREMKVSVNPLGSGTLHHDGWPASRFARARNIYKPEGGFFHIEIGGVVYLVEVSAIELLVLSAFGGAHYHKAASYVCLSGVERAQVIDECAAGLDLQGDALDDLVHDAQTVQCVIDILHAQCEWPHCWPARLLREACKAGQCCWCRLSATAIIGTDRRRAGSWHVHLGRREQSSMR